MDQAEFQRLLTPVIDLVARSEINRDLEQSLHQQFPPGSGLFNAIEQACHTAIQAGWMCAEGQEGRRFGRVIEATDDSSRLSVDVVDLKNVIGPHHRHPNGEICMIMPITPKAQFNSRGAGWCVYPPNSEHFPTVKSGQALVLYLLPEGAIEFTGKEPPTEN